MAKNPTRYEPGWPSAVIASAHQTGVLGMRNLARRGVPVCCIDCDRSLPGFQRVYGPAYPCPNPDEESERWLTFMLALAQKLPQRPVLIPASDQFLSAIATHAERLSQAFRIGAAPELQGRLGQKASLYALAAQHGMPIPRTEQVSSEEDILKFAAAAQFPCLIKPMSAREWDCFPVGHPLHLQKVAVAKDPTAFLAQYTLVRDVSPEVVVQEVIAGHDTDKYVYFSCYDRKGNRIANALFRELRCAPIGFGCASVCETAVDDEADRLCDEFLRKCGCRGLCEIELKRDSRSGHLLMIEANPRLSGSGDAATYVGVDLCWLSYLDQIGIDVAAVTPKSRSVRHIALRRDAQAIHAHLAAGSFHWLELFRSYRPPVAFYDLDLRDFRSAIGTLDHVARVFLGPIIRRLKRKDKAAVVAHM